MLRQSGVFCSCYVNNYLIIDSYIRTRSDVHHGVRSFSYLPQVMSHYRLGWAVRAAARNHYIVAAVAVCPGIFLAPTTSPLPPEAPSTTIRGGDRVICLGGTRSRGRAMLGATGIKQCRPSGRRPSNPSAVVPFSFFHYSPSSSSILHGLRPRPRVPGPSDRLTPPMLPA